MNPMQCGYASHLSTKGIILSSLEKSLPYEVN